MPLNKQSGNMYEWVSHTWNPLGGACPHECSYCSTGALMQKYETLKTKYSGPLFLVEKEMKTNLGKGNTIFVCNMTDLFAREVSEGIILEILHHCRNYPDNTYLLQSKNPVRFLEIVPEAYPPKVIFCTTLETNVKSGGISKAPIPRDRADAMLRVRETFPEAKVSVTIEPIMDFWEFQFLQILKDINPDFVSIGADSKRSGLPEPTRDKVNTLIAGLEKAGIKIEKKNNLGRLTR